MPQEFVVIRLKNTDKSQWYIRTKELEETPIQEMYPQDHNGDMLLQVEAGHPVVLIKKVTSNMGGEVSLTYVADNRKGLRMVMSDQELEEFLEDISANKASNKKKSKIKEVIPEWLVNPPKPGFAVLDEIKKAKITKSAKLVKIGSEVEPPKKRGRPKKIVTLEIVVEEEKKKKRGRPRGSKNKKAA